VEVIDVVGAVIGWRAVVMTVREVEE